MIWNATLETGMPAIDDQHKELFRQARVLFDRENADRVTQTLDFLEKYVEKHFGDEQALHLKAQYPKLEPHKKMHAEFVIAFKKMQKEYEDEGHKLQVLLKINKTFSDWLTNHIMVHDKEFATYYNAKQAK